MKAIIKNIDQDKRKVTIIRYHMIDKEGDFIIVNGIPMSALEPFTIQDLTKYEGKQVIESTDYMVTNSIITVTFSEDDFSEDYTFYIEHTNPIDEEINEKNIDDRIKQRIQEELIIYKNRKDAIKPAIKISTKVGDNMEF